MILDMLAATIAGMFLGGGTFWVLHRLKTGGFERLAQEVVSEAEKDAERLKQEAALKLKEEALTFQKKLDLKWSAEKEKFQREEARLSKREDKLETRMSLLEQKLSLVEKQEKTLALGKEENSEEKLRLSQLSETLMAELEKLSGMTCKEAKKRLCDQLIDEVKREVADDLQRMRKEAEENAQKEAARIITTAISRLAVSCTSESTSSVISLPSSDLKGRIIGREGRNIRLFEKLTGVNVLIDDTPNAVVLSGFDPARLYVAKSALTKLVEDGRIHPTSIEKSVADAQQSMDALIIRSGEEAALETGQIGLHPEVLKLLGGLSLRCSYGQNVLKHSIEVSHLMGMIAAELRLDIKLAKRIGLLHDMGKAASQLYEGTHALVGQKLALKYGEASEVANGIGCHHHEIEPITVEGRLCAIVDAMSASRPGARLEAVEQYLKRLQNLEEIAYEFEGIEKAYAMQAGREVFICVRPEVIDDAGADQLAREISHKIEAKLQYPGKVKVTILREKSAIAYAH